MFLLPPEVHIQRQSKKSVVTKSGKDTVNLTNGDKGTHFCLPLSPECS